MLFLGSGISIRHCRTQGKRRVRVPVLVGLGVRRDGERVILDMCLAGDESTAEWRDVIRCLVERHVGVPTLAIIDGSAGLAAALREQWPTLAIRRCTTHYADVRIMPMSMTNARSTAVSPIAMSA